MDVSPLDMKKPVHSSTKRGVVENDPDPRLDDLHMYSEPKPTPSEKPVEVGESDNNSESPESPEGPNPSQPLRVSIVSEEDSMEFPVRII